MGYSRIVIVGGGIAGLMAAETAKRTCSNSKVTIFSDEPLPYRRSALTSIIKGGVKEKEILIFPQNYLSSINVKMNAGVSVVDIDSKNNLVKHTNSRGSIETVNYDKLILATGGYAIKPPLEGVDKEGVFTLRSIHDALEIRRLAEKASSATIVGAGFIGLLTAEALAKRGLKVNLLEKLSRVLWTILESDMSKTIQTVAKRHGVRILTGVSIEKLGGGNRVKWIETSTGRVYSDLVVFAIGVRPRVELAEAAGVSVGKFGITVNGRMQTSIDNIYAAGDCVEVVEVITKRKAYLPLGSLAAAEGEIAGSNSAGRLIESEGFLRAQDEELFDLHIVSIGHTTESAREANLKAEAIDIAPPKSHSLRGIKGLQAKFIINGDNDLIGAQLIVSKHDLLAKSYPPMLSNFIREKTNLTEALEYFKRHYRTLPEYILWRSLR